MCGPSGDEKAAFGEMKTISQEMGTGYQTLLSQAQSIFGSSSKIFSDLTSAFEPILAAGPGQQGYTAPEMARLKSEAITESGQAYRNAAAAAGERTAAAGGGNALLPSGSTAQIKANIAQAGAAQTAGELANIEESSAQLGRQNWITAAKFLGGAPDVFNPATSAGSVSTSAGATAMKGAEQYFNTANTMNQQSGWWKPIVGGVLGAGLDVVTGGLSGMMQGGSFISGAGQALGGQAVTG